jgi:prephenate dehydrogenase
MNVRHSLRHNSQMDRIAIIGLGFVGASVGYALRARHGRKFTVIGFDHDSEAQRRADKAGAVDETEWGMPAAVGDADIVVIATPAGSGVELLKDMAPHLKTGTVVTDTTTAARGITEAAEEVFRRDVTFVSGHPLISGSGFENASADLFDEQRWALAATTRAPQDGVRILVDFVEKLGAKPLFISVEEHDSYMAAAAHLPVIVGHALMLTAARSPSWREIGKFAGEEFDSISKMASSHPKDTLGAVAGNHEMLLHWIDQMILELSDFRSMLADDSRADEEGILMGVLDDAWDARIRWENDIVPGDIERPSLPSAGDYNLGLLIGHKAVERLRSSDSRASEASRTRDW